MQILEVLPLGVVRVGSAGFTQLNGSSKAGIGGWCVLALAAHRPAPGVPKTGDAALADDNKQAKNL